MSRRFVLAILLAVFTSHARQASSREAGEAAPAERPQREVLIGGGVSSMAAPRDSALELGPGLNVLFYYGGRHFAAVAQVLLGRSAAAAYAVTYSA
jgi:hypothetical protein